MTFNRLYDAGPPPAEGDAVPPMTDAELRIWREQMRKQNLLPPVAKKWPPPSPSTPEEMALRCSPPRPPRPTTPEGIAGWALANQLWEQDDMVRHRAWLDLGDRRSQVEADARFNDPAESYYRCQLVSVSPELDCGFPPLLVRGKSKYEAGDRYVQLVGLLNWDHAAHDLRVESV